MFNTSVAAADSTSTPKCTFASSAQKSFARFASVRTKSKPSTVGSASTLSQSWTHSDKSTNVSTSSSVQSVTRCSRVPTLSRRMRSFFTTSVSSASGTPSSSALNRKCRMVSSKRWHYTRANISSRRSRSNLPGCSNSTSGRWKKRRNQTKRSSVNVLEKRLSGSPWC